MNREFATKTRTLIVPVGLALLGFSLANCEVTDGTDGSATKRIEIPDGFLDPDVELNSQAATATYKPKPRRTMEGTMVNASKASNKIGIYVWQWFPVAQGRSMVVEGYGKNGTMNFRHQSTMLADRMVMAQRTGSGGRSQFFLEAELWEGSTLRSFGTPTTFQRQATERLVADFSVINKLDVPFSQCGKCVLQAADCALSFASCYASGVAGAPDPISCGKYVISCNKAVLDCETDPCDFFHPDDNEPSCGMSGAHGSGGNNELRECTDLGTGGTGG